MSAPETLTSSDLAATPPDVPKQYRDPNIWADDAYVLKAIEKNRAVLDLGACVAHQIPGFEYASTDPTTALEPRYPTSS
jgi:hypothetical protein